MSLGLKQKGREPPQLFCTKDGFLGSFQATLLLSFYLQPADAQLTQHIALCLSLLGYYEGKDVSSEQLQTFAGRYLTHHVFVEMVR